MCMRACVCVFELESEALYWRQGLFSKQPAPLPSCGHLAGNLLYEDWGGPQSAAAQGVAHCVCARTCVSLCVCCRHRPAVLILLALEGIWSLELQLPRWRIDRTHTHAHTDTDNPPTSLAVCVFTKIKQPAASNS